VASKQVGGKVILRPVQVRGKNPTAEKVARPAYPWIGELSRVHEEMAIVVCYFSTDHNTPASDNIAFVPFALLIPSSKGRYRFTAVSFKNGTTNSWQKCRRLFGVEALAAMESPCWAQAGQSLLDGT